MRPILAISLLLFTLFRASAQRVFVPGDPIRKGADIVDIPFEYSNGFILIDLVFDRHFPLRFLFDTGAENTILTKKEITDILGIPYQRTFPIIGADMRTELTAHLATGIHLRIGVMELPLQPILVLDEDFFQFEEFTGKNIHGILGANIFRNSVVKINYQRRVISLINPRFFHGPPAGFTEIDLEIKKKKPYLFVQTDIADIGASGVKLLLDTGAGLSMILNTNTHPNLQLPDNVVTGNIGAGLGGYLQGTLGRVDQLQFADQLLLRDVPVNFQEITTDMDTSFLNNRNGILGNEILRRFTVIIDYPHQKLYLKPNRYYFQKFELDKSGLVIVVGGSRLNEYIVHSVLPGSPAEEAGILPGDQIRRINGWGAGFLGLDGINNKLRKKTGKHIRLVLIRHDEKIKRQFRLRKLL